MTYKVIARKWRPQNFEEVVGQRHITQTLANAIAQNRVAHAYLFSGPRGTGKTTVARILAKALNCGQGPTPQPCGTCESCLAIAESNDLDVLEIDGASNRGIDEIRSLREMIKLAPSRGRYKVYIIDEVHMLTEFAFNALLKTLEEPPAKVVFILATTAAHKVLPTIVSRCQHFHFRRLPAELITERLTHISKEESISIDPAVLSFIARQAEGGLRDALGILEQAAATTDSGITLADVEQVLDLSEHSKLLALLSDLVNGNGSEALATIRQLYSDGANLEHLLESLIDMADELLLIRAGAFDEAYSTLSPEEIAELTKLAEGKDLAELFTMINALIRAKGDYLRAVDPLTALELAALRASRLVLSIPVDKALSGLKLEGEPAGATEASEPLPRTPTKTPAKQRPASPARPTAPPQTSADLAKDSSDAGRTPEVPSAGGEGERWSQLLNHLKKHNPRTAGLLKDALMMEFSAEKLVLSYPESYSFHIEKLKEEEIQESLRKAVLELTSQQPEIVVITHEKTPPSSAAAAETPPKKPERGKKSVTAPPTATEEKDTPIKKKPETSSEKEASSEDIFGKSDDPLVQKELERFRAQIVKRKNKKEPEEK
jgi:DNA polymerase-3 subunit gamma/tau